MKIQYIIGTNYKVVFRVYQLNHVYLGKMDESATSKKFRWEFPDRSSRGKDIIGPIGIYVAISHHEYNLTHYEILNERF